MEHFVFIKLIVLPHTLFAFFVGYISVFIIMLFRKIHIISLLWSSFIGGLSFVGIWIFILAILNFLLSQEDLENCFHLLDPKNSDSSLNFSTKIDDDELTMDELYGKPSKQNENVSNKFSSDDPDNDKKSSFASDDFENEDYISSEEPKSSLNADGTFDLSVNGRLVRSTPKEGAQAITKVITDDKISS